MIARFEDTRDLRLMGGYHTGPDPDLDQAVSLVPIIYEALSQSPAIRHRPIRSATWRAT